MSRQVKAKRSYDSTRRREQAAANRREILAAAERLFESDGYAATTVGAIAAEAGVSVKTVYLGFETKSGILRALWNLRLRGDDEEIPVAQREWYREAVEEPDPERKLRLNARNSAGAKQRIGAVLEIIHGAAPVDPDIAALWERIQTEFHANQRVIIEELGARGALRPGLDVETATDIAWSLNHPYVWKLLVGERGWTPERYEEWLGDTFCSQLLPDSG